ncbi:MAG TPA: hypothetical protein VK982_06105 [Bacteroidales bacterium]|nr:hypothetical protein [Bacteroidales bacterium]
MKQYNKTSTLFLLPLIDLEREKVFNDSYVTTYIKDNRFPFLENQIILVYNKQQELIEANKNINSMLKGFTEEHVYYIDIPEEFVKDYKYVLQGRYSELSSKAKEKIIKFWNVTSLSIIYGILYKTELAKVLYLTNIYKGSISPNINLNLEYWPKPNLSEETIF